MDVGRLARARGPALRRLPPRVALFQVRAHALALRLGDVFALAAAARPDQLAALLALARGRRTIVELGTATGWTAASLALAEPGARVISVDPVEQPHRARYLALAGGAARARVEVLRATGVEAAHSGPAAGGERGSHTAGGSQAAGGVDLLFIDSSHERQATVDEFRAWEPRLARGAVVVFHDHGNPQFPGVEEAVHELGVAGEAAHGMFVTRR